MTVERQVMTTERTSGWTWNLEHGESQALVPGIDIFCFTRCEESQWICLESKLRHSAYCTWTTVIYWAEFVS
jgi:hypothetical protein